MIGQVQFFIICEASYVKIEIIFYITSIGKMAHTCSICLDAISETNHTITQCGHHFHSSCILTQVVHPTHPSSNCAICRSPLYTTPIPISNDDHTITEPVTVNREPVTDNRESVSVNREPIADLNTNAQINAYYYTMLNNLVNTDLYYTMLNNRVNHQINTALLTNNHITEDQREFIRNVNRYLEMSMLDNNPPLQPTPPDLILNS